MPNYTNKGMSSLNELIAFVVSSRENILKRADDMGIYIDTSVTKHITDSDAYSIARSIKADAIDLEDDVSTIVERFQLKMKGIYDDYNISTLARIIDRYGQCKAGKTHGLEYSLAPSNISLGKLQSKEATIPYYDKRCAEAYELHISYYCLTGLLTSLREFRGRVYLFNEKRDAAQRKMRRNIFSIRKKYMEDIARLLPGAHNNNRWSDDPNVLCSTRRGHGWMSEKKHKHFVMPRGTGYVPIAMIHHTNDCASYDDSLGFITTNENTQKLYEIMGESLAVNANDNKTGFVTYIHEQLEDQEAADESIELYKVNVRYLSSYRSLKKFNPDNILDHREYDGNRTTKAFDRKYNLASGLERSQYSMPPIHSVFDKEETVFEHLNSTPWEQMKEVHASDSVIPSVRVKVYKPKDGEEAQKLSSKDPSYHTDMWTPTAIEVDRSGSTDGFDVDTSKEAVINIGRGSCILKDRVYTRNSVNEAYSVPIDETRYLAVWNSDTGEKVVVSGTTPKRTLANIRRRIRSKIVDTLDIF